MKKSSAPQSATRLITNSKRCSHLLVLFLLLMSTLLTGCFEKKLKDINIGVESWYPPFSFEQNGDIRGFDIDLLTAVLSKMGYNAKFQTLKFDEMEDALKDGKIDIIASGMSITSERLKEFEFSLPYYKPSFALLYKRTKFGDLLSIEQLSKMSIGVERGTTMNKFLDFVRDQRQLVVERYSDSLELLNALKSNEISAALVENLEAEVIAQNNSDIDFFAINSKDMAGFGDNEDLQYAYAFRKNSRLTSKFNEILESFQSDGTIDILKLRWFSGYGTYGNSANSK